MQSLFDPVIVGIIHLIEEQIKAAKKKNGHISVRNYRSFFGVDSQTDIVSG